MSEPAIVTKATDGYCPACGHSQCESETARVYRWTGLMYREGRRVFLCRCGHWYTQAEVNALWPPHPDAEERT